MKILVISLNYPSPQNPVPGIFVYRLVQKFCEQGHEVTVVSPQRIWRRKIRTKDYGHEKAVVYRPGVLSFSAKKIGNFNSYAFTRWFLIRAIKKTVKKLPPEFDVVYCHFLRSAFVAIEALAHYNKPFIAAVGENKGIDYFKKWYKPPHFMNLLGKISGFVVVSDQIKAKLSAMGVPDNKMIVAPNATDLSAFKKADKIACRQKYAIPAGKFVVLFTGNFIESKGPHRVLKAIEGLENVVVMFIGSGPIGLESPQIVFKRRVTASQMPELLNCADVFVLPTLHEGSNNSIVEAMACGLPIISSDIPEVRSQCDPSFSILVDPMDIQAIRKAIIRLRDDESMCASMSENAVQWARRFDLNRRVEKILAFIQDQLK